MSTLVRVLAGLFGPPLLGILLANSVHRSGGHPLTIALLLEGAGYALIASALPAWFERIVIALVYWPLMFGLFYVGGWMGRT